MDFCDQRRSALAAPLLALLMALAGVVAWAPAQPASAQIEGLPVMRGRPGTRAVGSVWGIFIGVSRFTKPELNIPLAAADADALHLLYTRQFEGAIAPDHFIRVTNEQVTRTNLARVFRSVFVKAAREDVVLVFMGTHAVTDPLTKQLLFFTHRTDPTFPAAESLPMSELLSFVDRGRANRIIWMMDLCHTGTADATNAEGALPMAETCGGSELAKGLKPLGGETSGSAVLTSTSDAEFGDGSPDFCSGHGAFACGLLSGLTEGDQDQDGLITLGELVEKVRSQVVKLTRGTQTPNLSGRFDENLPICRTRAVAKPTVERLELTPAEAMERDYNSVMSGTSPPLPLGPDETPPTLAARAWAVVEKYATDASLPLADREAFVERFVKNFATDIAPEAGMGERLLEVLRGTSDMVYVPAGVFSMGCNEDVDAECYPDEKPRRRVYLGGYFIEKNEVTVAQYRQCVTSGACSPPPQEGACAGIGKAERDDRPMVCVGWQDARAYCTYRRRRLPTEAEWEKAAKGIEPRRYPWGNEPATCDRAITSECKNLEGGVQPVGVRPKGASPYGVYDMAGNAWEWVSDFAAPYLNLGGIESQPVGPKTGTRHVLRGGSYDDGARDARTTNRLDNESGSKTVRNGFRCAERPVEGNLVTPTADVK